MYNDYYYFYMSKCYSQVFLSGLLNSKLQKRRSRQIVKEEIGTVIPSLSNIRTEAFIYL